MKFHVNGDEVLDLNETKMKVICNDIMKEEFDSDMKRRVQYIISHKYQRCFERLYKEWVIDSDGKGSKLAKNGIKSIPTDPDELAELIFSQPNYSDRSKREKDKQ